MLAAQLTQHVGRARRAHQASAQVEHMEAVLECAKEQLRQLEGQRRVFKLVRAQAHACTCTIS